MAQNITLLGASYSAVPAVQLPKTGGGTAKFTDVTDTTATASDVASGTYFYTANGTRTQGTASGGSSVTVEPFTVTTSGTFTAPTGTAYSPINVTKGYANPPASISSSGATGGNSGTNVVVTKTVSVTPSVTSGWITSGTAGNVDITLQASDANFVAGNIRDGISIFGLVGTFTGGGGSSKNIQYSTGRYEISATAYTATSLSIKVSKAGTYKCYWTMDRNTSSGTSGSRLYNGETALGSAHTSWTYNNNNRYGMNCEETLTFAANDTITVRARSRSTSYICGVENFFIVEQ